MSSLRGPAQATVRRVRDIVRGEASEGHRLRSASKAISFNVRTRLLRRPTVAAIGDHSKIIVYPGETNSPLAAYHNPPSPSQMNVWRRHLKPGDLFLDIGANVGIYMMYALDLGARVIACEPDPRNYQRLLEHLRLNDYRAEVLNLAVADKPGLSGFTQGLDSLNHLVLDQSGDIEVETTTLDSILGDRYAAGVKIDVEGAERLVLAGAARALAERRIGMLQFEWAGLQVEADDVAARKSPPDLLRDAGYSLQRADINGVLTQVTSHPEAGHGLHGRDLFAVSPDL